MHSTKYVAAELAAGPVLWGQEGLLPLVAEGLPLRRGIGHLSPGLTEWPDCQRAKYVQFLAANNYQTQWKWVVFCQKRG